MSKSFPLPPPPQTGYKPIMLHLEHEKRLLQHRNSADLSDPFVLDADEHVRRLGKLALRRGEFDPADYLALGDMCANLSLNEDQLLILYVGKTLAAYRRVRQQARAFEERNTAEQAIAAYIRWIMDIACKASNMRNI